LAASCLFLSLMVVPVVVLALLILIMSGTVWLYSYIRGFIRDFRRSSSFDKDEFDE
jgi:predicted MFS family arabinose efflux permease